MPVVVSAPVSTRPWIARSIERGAQLAVDEINEDGGVRLKGGARKLKLVVLDNGSSPATALANAREAVERNAAALLTDGTGAVSVASVTDRAKLPVFVLFEGGARLIDPAAHPSLFRLAPADAIMTRRLADYIANSAPKVALLTDDSGYGEQGRAALRDAFRVDHVQVGLGPGDPGERAGPRTAGARRPPRGRRPPDRVGERGRCRRRARGRGPRRLERPGHLRRDGRGPADPSAARSAPGLAALAALRPAADPRRNGPKPFNAFGARYESALGKDKVGVKQDGRDVIQPPDWAMYPYDALLLVREAIDESGALGAPLLQTINDGARITGANGDQRAYNASYHEGVSPSDMYFARFRGFVFEPVKDDPLSGTLPIVDQLD